MKTIFIRDNTPQKHGKYNDLYHAMDQLAVGDELEVVCDCITRVRERVVAQKWYYTDGREWSTSRTAFNAIVVTRRK